MNWTWTNAVKSKLIQTEPKQQPTEQQPSTKPQHPKYSLTAISILDFCCSITCSAEASVSLNSMFIAVKSQRSVHQFKM